MPAIIAFAINFSIALIVFLDDPKKSLNRWFAGFVLMFAIWNMSEVIILNSAQYEKALLGAQILYRAIFLTPALFLIISYIFPKQGNKFTRKWWFKIIILGLPILILADSFPDFAISLIPFTQSKNVYYYHINMYSSPSFIVLIIVTFGYMGWGMSNLLRRLNRAKTIREKNQIWFLLVGVFSIFLIFILMNAFQGLYGKIFSFYFFSTLLSLSISFFFFAAIMQYRLINISRLITGGLTYSLLSSIILAIYFLIVKGLSQGLTKILGVNSFLLDAFLILTLIFLIRPFEIRIQHIIDRLLYKDIYTYRRRFLEFTRELLSYFDRDTFLKKIVQFLKEIFGVKNVHVFIKNRDTGKYFLWDNVPSSPEIPPNHTIIRQIFKAKSAIEFFELDQNKISIRLIKFLNESHASIFLPFIYESELLGFIILSEKSDLKSFTQEEMEILSIFSNEMASTYIRNRFIDQMREEERRQSYIHRLATLGQLTAGIAHEIRNPLNTIATSAETLIKRRLDKETEEELKTYILDDANRVNNILTDFLRLSRIREPKIKDVAISEFLEKISFDIEYRFQTNIELSVENKIRDKTIRVDSELLQQVLLNLGLNCIEAIQEKQASLSGYTGKIMLLVKKIGRKIQFEIIDNGAGIPPENHNRIFDPFFTTKADGTGLGLPISFNIIETLGGKMRFRSSKDGTRFTITLPAVSKIPILSGN